MKKVLLILAVVSLYSCTKCATCTQVTTVTTSHPQQGYPHKSTTTFKACGDDLKQIKGSEIKTVATVGNITTTSITKTACN